MAPKRQPRSNAAAIASRNASLEAAIVDQIASRSSKVCHEVRAYLETEQSEGHARAKKLVPFVGQVLKQCGVELAKLDLETSIASDLFDTMDVALDCLEKLRTWLAGGALDIEIQRYGVVRRLMAWKKFSRAAEECRKVFCGLNACVRSRSSSREMLAAKDQLILPPGAPDDLPAGLAALVIGLAGDFILCTVEGAEGSSVDLQQVLRIPAQLDPWLRTMDSDALNKHRESFFRMLFRAAACVSSDSTLDPDVVAAFCKVALEWCLSSSLFDQYLKVARKLCCNLFAAPTSVNIGLNVFATVVSELQRQIKKSDRCVCELLATNLILEELRWLISATYNLGVQNFNRKQYELACRPFELCFDAAWIRVDALCRMSSTNLAYDAVSEGSAKTSAFVDSLKRSSNHEAASEALLRALKHWASAHSYIRDLEGPRTLLNLWRKFSHSQSSAVLRLYTSLGGLSKISLGLILEEYLAVLHHDPDETLKEELIRILIEKVYLEDGFALERSRLLIEKSRLVRKQGVSNVNASVGLLTEAVQITDDALNAGTTVYNQAELKYYLAASYCLRAHCTQEENPFSQIYLEDITSALDIWQELLTAKDHIWSFLSKRLQTMEPAMHLLSSIADLLSLKGNAALMLKTQQATIQIASKYCSTSEQQLSLWAHSRISHVLCTVPFSKGFILALKNTPVQEVDTLAFWCRHARTSPCTLSDARQYVVYADTSRFEEPLKEFAEDLEKALQDQSPPPKGSSVREVLALAARKFHLADVLMQRGDIGAALKIATDCLRLRLKLVNSTFHFSKQNAGGKKQIDASGSSAIYAWPSLGSAPACSAASQWHILGDYLESLMQAGVLNQAMGIADDAEKNFREGLWLSEAKHLPLSQALFASCLGEVHRKEHLWDSARENLDKASRLFEELEGTSCCSHCTIAGKASLQLRLGDFTRRYSTVDDQNSADAAVCHYDSALVLLKELPGGTTYRPLILKCNSRSKKQPETTSKNLFHEFSKIDVESNSMSAWIDYRWELLGRRLAGKILLQQGKCNYKMRDHSKAEESFLRALSVLRDSGCCLSAPHWNWLPTTRCMFPLEESALLYHLSLLLLWLNHDSRNPRERAPSVTWLYRAFILSCAAPPLFRKISQVLAVIHAFPSVDILDFPAGKKTIELKETAAYFHQASIGSRIRQQHLLMLQSKLDIFHDQTVQGKEECVEKMMKALRVLPEDNVFPVSEVKNLKVELPSTTICCVSFVEQEFAFLLQEEHLPNPVVWLLVSRFGDGDVILSKFPIQFSLQDLAPESSCDDENNRGRHKSILESDSLLRNVLPELASILHESRQSTSSLLPISTQEDKNQWWKWRTNLDVRLATFLRKVEDSWFGPWKCLLLGEPSESSLLQAFRKKAKELCRLLKSKAFLGQNKPVKVPEEAAVKVLLQGVGYLDKGSLRTAVSSILGEGSESAIVDSAVEAFETGYASIFIDTSKKSKTRKGTRLPSPPGTFEREPVQLVLDGRLQGFPWESLPIMRKLEAFRMPSLGSIRALSIYHKYAAVSSLDISESLGRLELDEGVEKCEGSKPYVNPYNAFYLLNPSGDLESTQIAFEEWFRRQKGWEGKAGQVPTIEEYIAGLQQHDLFVYLGHGSGDQYLPEKYIRKLDNCPAALLMGCSSGRFSSRGDYEPVGVPLSYLMAGCPVAIANLWDVTDGDIDRFSRTLLHKWLDKQEITSSSSGNSVVEVTSKVKTSRRARGKAEAPSESSSTVKEWEEIPIGPSVEAGRDACKLPYLIGASPVCFGVPTLIRRSVADLG